MHTIKKTYGEWECDCGFSGETVALVLAHVDDSRLIPAQDRKDKSDG